MTRDQIVAAMVAELTRQANEDKAGTPYFDGDNVREALIDGRVDLEALADAVLKA